MSNNLGFGSTQVTPFLLQPRLKQSTYTTKTNQTKQTKQPKKNNQQNLLDTLNQEKKKLEQSKKNNAYLHKVLKFQQQLKYKSNPYYNSSCQSCRGK